MRSPHRWSFTTFGPCWGGFLIGFIGTTCRKREHRIVVGMRLQVLRQRNDGSWRDSPYMWIHATQNC